MAQMSLTIKQKQTQRCREQNHGCWGGDWWRGMDWELGISRCKLLHIEWKNSKVLLYSTGNYIQHLRVNCNEEGYKKKNLYMHITEPLCCTVEINNIVSQLCEWKLPIHGWLFAIPMDYTVHGILQARILEWVTFPFSRGSSQPRDLTQVSHIAGRFFTSWATRKAQETWSG